MNARRHRVGLTVAAAVAAGACLWLPLVTYNDLPPFEAGDVARRHATACGYDVSDCGTSGDYVTQPDAFGGCEVEVTFRPPDDGVGRPTLAVRLRRPNALVPWHVTDVSVRTPADRVRRTGPGHERG